MFSNAHMTQSDCCVLGLRLGSFNAAGMVNMILSPYWVYTARFRLRMNALVLERGSSLHADVVLGGCQSAFEY